MVELYSNYNHLVLSELTWNKTFNLPESSIIDCDRNMDPNSYNNIDIMSKWIEYSDFYNENWMPHITYFDSFEDLQSKLMTTNLIEISGLMSEFNKIRKEKIYNLWDKKIKSIYEKFSNR